MSCTLQVQQLRIVGQHACLHPPAGTYSPTYGGSRVSPRLIMHSALQRDYSVAHITGSQTVVAGKPELNGLSDTKLGPVDKLSKCPTDAAGLQDCPGYFGHIELAKPMYHIGFLTTVIKILRCVSFAGSRLMVSRVSC